MQNKHFPLLITTKIFCRLHISHKSLNVSAQIQGSGSHVTTGQLGLGAKPQSYDNRAKGRENTEPAQEEVVGGVEEQQTSIMVEEATESMEEV